MVKSVGFDGASRKILPGIFSTPGTAHMHIDAGDKVNIGVVEDVVRNLNLRGFYSKVSTVVSSVEGPQRLKYPDHYAIHNPVSAATGEDGFESFSTTLVNRHNIIGGINFVLGVLSGIPGVVVEVEQVIARFREGEWVGAKAKSIIPPIQPGQVHCEPSPSLAFEIHHGLDIKNDQIGRSLSLDELLKYSEQNGIEIGGWFLFESEDKNTLKFRSNSFIGDSIGIQEQVISESEVLGNFLDQRGVRVLGRKAVVERVLGIWSDFSVSA